MGLLRCFQTSNEADVSWTASRATKPDSGTRPPTPDWASTSPFAPNVPNEAFTSMTRPSPNYRIYHNLWFHNMKWYAFLPADEADDPSIEDGLSPNAVVIRMPITDLRNYTRQLRMSYVSGNSALLDLTFQAYPSHLGHWLELMVPLYSVLREGDWAHYCKGSSADLDHVVTPNVAEYYSSWAAKAFLVTLKPTRDNGNKVDQIDYGDLMGVDKLSWILFENVLVLQDRYTHPQRKVGFIGPEHGDLWRYDGCDRWVSSTFVPSFWSQESGQAFRRMAYEAAPWDIPEPWTPGSPPPKREYMTLLLNADDEPNVYNRVELTELIHELAEEFGLKGRVISLTNEAPFVSHLETVANSAVLVARHSSLLASTVFMPPGSSEVVVDCSMMSELLHASIHRLHVTR
ncbi:hypothetical protein CEUSTIGMA_g11758.t1 [Chlamydomonas eustigma]|uniref:Glycosyltransferase family 61 protein n=1 Tax=Chlamydomonas eustigma TaxID=1157962 RepID=A0A250XMU2_9CHLO|nr:hypothetical protein CEUSTIGMA_g11758.t1 [Chlamydomonas eustigma]|eukprot:GAX84336.1 hypothetical protein CEUSTIGMA_g11758.t1 [Chlamydomonas eustigma]